MQVRERQGPVEQAQGAHALCRETLEGEEDRLSPSDLRHA